MSSNDDDERINITIRKRTHERLRSLGKMGESWDDLLNRLADGAECVTADGAASVGSPGRRLLRRAPPGYSVNSPKVGRRKEGPQVHCGALLSFFIGRSAGEPLPPPLSRESPRRNL